MGRIFLSYARDDRATAERLAQVLADHGHDVWWDRNIEGGAEFAEEIEAELGKAEAIVVAWSATSVKSRWVRDEAAVGGDSGRLIPVSIDGTLSPMGFRQFQTIDLNGWKGGKRDPRTVELVRAVEGRVGKKRASTSSASDPGAQPAKRSVPVSRRWIGGAALLLFLGAAAIGLWLLIGPGSSGSGPLKPTIALQPFRSPSSDPELQRLASQSADSIAHTFSQSGVPVRVAASAPQPERADADFLMSGDFSRSGDKILATIRLIEAAEGVTVFSHQFEAARADADALPERIGAQLAGDLTWAASLKMLDRRHPIAPALLADLLQDAAFDTSDPLQSYQAAKRITAKAPDLADGHISLAFGTGFILGELPLNERSAAVAEGRRSFERALVLAPDFGDTYASWCGLYSETRKAECEDQLNAGRRADPDAPFLNTFLSHLMRNVGRFDNSIDLAKLAHAHDIYVPTKIAWMLKSLEYQGASDDARALYDQGVRWWPTFSPMFYRNRLFGLLDRGDFSAIQRLEQEVGAANLQSNPALGAAVEAGSIAAARRACPKSDDYVMMLRCMVAFAALGDQDSAFAFADQLYPRRMGRTPAETERIWLDDPDGIAPLEFITSSAAAPMRRDPRYLALAERVGLLAYWRTGRLPDFCRKQPEPICAKLRRG